MSIINLCSHVLLPSIILYGVILKLYKHLWFVFFTMCHQYKTHATHLYILTIANGIDDSVIGNINTYKMLLNIQ